MSKKPTSKQQRRGEKKRQEPARRRHESRGTDTSSAIRFRMSRDEKALRDELLAFAYQPRFHDDFDRALPLFFGEEVALTRRIVADEEEMIEFAEWYIYDF